MISFISYPFEKAQALTMACSERGASYRLLTGADGTLVISVTEYDALSWQAVRGDGTLMVNIGAGFQAAPVPGSFSTYQGLATVSLRIDGAADAQSAVSCIPGDSPTISDGLAGVLAANSQTFATGHGVGTNAKNRFRSGGSMVSQNTVFVSTSNMGSNRFLPPDWNAWVTFEGRNYSGGIDGLSFDLVGGIDYLVTPNTLIGLLGGYGLTNITDSGISQNVSSPMVGGYFGQNFNDTLILDGFLSWAQPNYAVNGTTFVSSRVSAGLTLTGSYQGRAHEFEPFLFARGFQEDQPSYWTGGGALIGANSIDGYAASLGVKVKFTGGAEDRRKLVPYLSAAADFKTSTSTLGGSDSFIAPRLGLGFQGQIGKGQVSVDIDIGKVRSDTYDQGVKLGYELKF